MAAKNVNGPLLTTSFVFLLLLVSLSQDKVAIKTVERDDYYYTYRKIGANVVRAHARCACKFGRSGH